MSQAISGVIIGGGNIYSSPATKHEFLVNTTNKFTFKVVQSANQIITSTPVGRTVNNSDGTVSLALTDATTISPNTNYIPGVVSRSYDDNVHTYTVTATDAEPIDGLVQDGWSVVYQETPEDSEFYSKADYTGTSVSNSELQGNILIGGMKVVSTNEYSYSNPTSNNNILKFKNSFLTSAGNSMLGSCSGLTSVELPNLTSAGSSLLVSCSGLTSVELPNLTSAGSSLLGYCSGLTSVELPNLTSAGDYLLKLVEGNSSSPINFIDLGHLTKNFDRSIFLYTRVMVFRADTVPTNFTKSLLSDPVLYIVPSALVDTYKSKVRQGAAIYGGDVVTALEDSPFADGKTVCGNNMKTVYVYGMDGETPDLGEGTMLWFDGFNWLYVPYYGGSFASKTARAPEDSQLSGFYFLSKLTKERGYTIPTQGGGW